MEGMSEAFLVESEQGRARILSLIADMLPPWKQRALLVLSGTWVSITAVSCLFYLFAVCTIAVQGCHCST